MQIHVTAAVIVTVKPVKAVTGTVTVQAIETVNSRPILTVMNNAGTVTRAAAGTVTAPIDTVNLILTVMPAVMVVTAFIVASKGHRSSCCRTAARDTIHVFYVSVTDCKAIKQFLFIFSFILLMPTKISFYYEVTFLFS